MINYIGSKKRLLDFIDKAVSQRRPKSDHPTFVDLFAGTGVVAHHFSNKFRIIASDIQYYSYVLLQYQLTCYDPVRREVVEHLTNIKPVEGFIFENYSENGQAGRLYLSEHNGKTADAIRQEIANLYHKRLISEQEHFILIASLMVAVDKCANTTGVYGSYLKTLKASAERPLEFKVLPSVAQRPKLYHKVYLGSANKVIKLPIIKGDVLYLDPPYNNRQYNANYHLLETLARYDNPTLKDTATGLRADNHLTQSLFCSKSQCYDALKELIELAEFKHIFMSYGDNTTIPKNEVFSLLGNYGKVQMLTTQLPMYTTKQGDKSLVNEYLFHLTK